MAVRSGVRTFPAQHQELLQAVANQAALAVRNAEHIERLTAENLVRALFEALADGALDIAEARGRAAGCDLDRAHVFIHARPVATGEPARRWPEIAERVETRLRTLEAGALVDAGRDALRALLPLPAGARAGDVTALRELGASEGVAIGMSTARRGGDGAAAEPAPGPGRRQPSRRRSRPAAARSPTTSWAPTATSCTSPSTTRRTIGCARPWSACSITTSAARRSCWGRSSSTSPTGGSGRPRRAKLFIHANTLRQRLERIQKLTGLDLATEDLLSLELAVKLVRLRRAGGAESPPRS